MATQNMICSSISEMLIPKKCHNTSTFWRYKTCNSFICCPDVLANTSWLIRKNWWEILFILRKATELDPIGKVNMLSFVSSNNNYKKNIWDFPELQTVWVIFIKILIFWCNLFCLSLGTELNDTSELKYSKDVTIVEMSYSNILLVFGKKIVIVIVLYWIVILLYINIHLFVYLYTENWAQDSLYARQVLCYWAISLAQYLSDTRYLYLVWICTFKHN